MRRIIFVSLLLFIFIAPTTVLALTGTCPAGLNCNTGLDFNGLVLKFINWILSIALAVDVLFIIIGGFFYIISAGNEEREHHGKMTVINAIVGLIIIIMSYVIAAGVSSYLTNL